MFTSFGWWWSCFGPSSRRPAPSVELLLALIDGFFELGRDGFLPNRSEFFLQTPLFGSEGGEEQGPLIHGPENLGDEEHSAENKANNLQLLKQLNHLLSGEVCTPTSS